MLTLGDACASLTVFQQLRIDLALNNHGTLFRETFTAANVDLATQITLKGWQFSLRDAAYR